MPYIEKVVTAGRVKVIRKYYSWRYGSHEKREIRGKPTPEAVARANLRQATERLEYLLDTNFQDGRDALMTLSFRGRPEEEEVKKRTQAFIRRLKRYCRKEQITCRYVYTIEIGPRGSRHVHMVLQHGGEIPPGRIREIWGEGPVNAEPLYTRGDYRGIAEYFTKYAVKTAVSGGRKLGKLYNASRNMRQPRIRRRVVNRITFSLRTRAPKGYTEVDRKQGTSELTGLDFLLIRMVRD